MAKEELKHVIQESFNEIIIEDAIRIVSEYSDNEALLEDSLNDMQSEYKKARAEYKSNIRKIKAYIKEKMLIMLKNI